MTVMTTTRLTAEEIQTTFAAALNSELLHDDDTAVIFYDLCWLKQRFEEIVAAFPPTAIPCVAVKANPLFQVLHRLQSWGAGFEVASLAELQLVRETGVDPQKLIYNSSVRTVAELETALRLGVPMNADSFAELDRMNALLSKFDPDHPVPALGLRINPQVGVGRIPTTGVAGEYSKFGVPIRDAEPIFEAYSRYPWLNSIHMHIGSQGCPPIMLREGLLRVAYIFSEVNRNRATPITTFNMGGGLPVDYGFEQQFTSVSEFAQQIREVLPNLWSDDVQLVTEFGRYLHANAGWVAARVEAVKIYGDVQTVLTHVGADLCVRECYQPGVWPHEVLAVDSAGQLKTERVQRSHIAGPLCFSGDFPARDVELPTMQPGDYILLRDMGAYTLSMWSRYNSRQVPRVIGYETANETPQWTELKSRETIDDVVRFWR